MNRSDRVKLPYRIPKSLHEKFVAAADELVISTDLLAEKVITDFLDDLADKLLTTTWVETGDS
jgi:predicted HicB family RNase H-like nuclease